MENTEENLESQKAEFWEKFQYVFDHKNVSSLLGLWKFHSKWRHLIESGITILVSAGLISLLFYFWKWEIIDKSSFGVMFGTVFGYLLSWRFGK
jgi:hypothetical protein